MNTAIQSICRYFVQSALLLAFSLMATITTPVHAEINPEIANCEELKDEATIFQAELCSAHLGCRMVLGIQKACTKAKQFLNRLKEAIGEGTKGFFGYRKEVTPEAVFEAAIGENVRTLNMLPEVQSIAKQIDEGVSAAGSRMLTGKNDEGLSWVYHGDVKDGKSNGFGIRVFSHGQVQRGKFVDNILVDVRDVIYTDGHRYIGEALAGIKHGIGALGFPSGAIAVGHWRDGQIVNGKYNRADGSRFEGDFKDSKRFIGKEYRSDGSIEEEGVFELGVLSVGTRFEPGGISISVNKPRELEIAAVAAEQRRQSEEVRAAQAFRDNLNTMNAGQLFAKADELAMQGDKARSRDVLRALVSRFPDHQLAENAADQLAGNVKSAGAESNNSATSGNLSANANGRVLPSASSTASGGNCAQQDKEIEAEFVRRNSSIPSNDNVAKLALVHSVSLRMRDVWLPCNAEKAKAYEQTAASVLKTCQGIAADVRLCTGDQPRTAPRTVLAQPPQSQAVAPPSTDNPQSRPCPSGMNLTTRGCRSGVAQ